MNACIHYMYAYILCTELETYLPGTYDIHRGVINYFIFLNNFLSPHICINAEAYATKIIIVK